MNEQEPVRDDVRSRATDGPTVPSATASDHTPDRGGPALAVASIVRIRRPLSRLTILVGLRRPHVVAGIAAVIVVTVTAGTLAWQQSLVPVRPSGSSIAGPTAASSGPTIPDVVPDQLPSVAVHRVAVLTAEHAVASVVQLDSRFRLTSADGTPASVLASRLTVTPNLGLAAVRDSGDETVTLTPNAPLTAGVVYRFELAGPAGELVDRWAFQARQPLHIVETLPNDEQSDVPLDSGIEVTFDQDGVGDVASHVTIEPAIHGRFETHGRTISFVPNAKLAAKTLYTVTVRKGVTVTDTGEQTEADTRFAFETTAGGSQGDESGLAFPSEETEAATGEPPTIGVWQFGDADHPVKKVGLSVYRFADLPSAIDGWRSLRGRPDWSRYSMRGLVETKSLRLVLSADVAVRGLEGSWWVTVPQRLAVGWYLVQLASTRPVQAVLEVTDLAGYVAVSETGTVIWANDLANGRPIAGAVATTDGTAFGRTDAKGLLLAQTPSSLLPKTGAACSQACDPVVVLTAPGGRAVFLPTRSSHEKVDSLQSGYMWSEADQRFWALLDTDRTLYRSTDTVNLWGLLRSRTDGTIPRSVTVRLRTTLGDEGASPAIAAVSVKASRTGTFIASIPLRNMPDGSYALDLLAGERTVRTVDIQVGTIAKPAYELQVTTGRRVYVAGDRIKVTVRASFFEGTPVPGVALRISSVVSRRATTAVDGTAVVPLTATPDPNTEGATPRSVDVTPARAEEGAIVGASQAYFIYPSTRVVSGQAAILGRAVVVKGSVHALARDRLEAALSSGVPSSDLDPNGPAVKGAQVIAHFIELVPVRSLSGTTYDFITKTVVPNYRIDIVRQDRGTSRVRTTAAGTFRVTLPGAVAGHDYEVITSVADADGHVWRATIQATSEANPHASREEYPWLQLTSPKPNDSNEFAIGEDIDVTMRGGDPSRSASRSSYLFFVAHQGIRSAVVQPAARFVTPFAPWGPPNVEIGAVRFDGRAYIGDVGFAARFRSSDRRLDVRLTSDATSYRPGETATVHVQTLDQRGRPVSATVVLRAVDEKLFSIAAAEADDPLTALYEDVESGILGTYASHQGPRPDGGGGDTTGGGDDRGNFRDTVLFRAVSTDGAGRASVSFRLSDDLTAWRVGASAFTGGLQAGSGSLLLRVGQPFFVDASIAAEYLVGDRPSISVRTYGSAVTSSTPVTIKVSSPTLGTSGSPVATTAFASVDVPLPPLRPGIQTVTITATTGAGSSTRADRLTRTFRVVETRLTRPVQSATTLAGGGQTSVPPGSIDVGSGLTSIVVSDAGSGAYLPLLEQLAAGSGARFEQALAADVADRLLVERFAFVADDLEPSGYAADRYQSADTGGVAILPYGGADLEASALAAVAAPGRFDRQALTAYLRSVHVDRETTSERRLLAAAGLAALGDPLLPELQRAAADSELTVRERLYVGIGLARMGDTATARSIASALAGSAGERLGSVARLRVGGDVADSREATALMAVLAAMTGDPRAPLFWAYVAGTPVGDRLESLPAIAYVNASLERLASRPATFRVTTQGRGTTVTLDRGKAYRLSLTPQQLATLDITRIDGTLAVVAGWNAAAAPSDFQPDPDATITRTASPAAVDGASLVQVDLTVTFGPQAAPGCHDVTDLLPSGLTPVGATAGWQDTSEEAQASTYVSPYEQSARLVRFCADPASSSTLDLRYFARAITPGSYIWEPAVMASTTEAGDASLTGGMTLAIR